MPNNSLFKKYLFVVVFILVCNTVYAGVDGVISPMNMGEVTNKKFLSKIDIEWSSGIPLIDVVINDKTHKFLFDTGAPTTIPSYLLEQLELKPLDQDITLFGAFGRKTIAQMYTLPSMQIGEINFSGLSVLIYDFSSLFPVSCLGFDGVLGLNALKDLNFKLDLSGDSIVISDLPIDTTGYVSNNIYNSNIGGISFELNFEFGNGYFLLDTGMNRHMKIGDPLIIPVMEAHHYASRKTTGIFSISLSGLNTVKEKMTYVARNLNIKNKIHINSVPIDIDKSNMYLVGNKLLRKFEIIIEMKKRKIYFRKKHDKRIADSFINNHGFTAMWNNKDHLYISAITEHTPAHDAGLEIGDRITSINSRNTVSFTKSEFCSLFKKEPMFPIEENLDISVIKNNGEVRNVTLRKP